MALTVRPPISISPRRNISVTSSLQTSTLPTALQYRRRLIAKYPFWCQRNNDLDLTTISPTEFGHFGSYCTDKSYRRFGFLTAENREKFIRIYGGTVL